MELSPDARAEVSEQLRDLAGAEGARLVLGREGVHALAAAGYEIGFHTLRHDPLPRLTDEELDRAMRQGRQALEEACGTPLETIAYPHGLADERVAATARRTGYAAGFTTEPHAVTPSSDPLLLGRVWASERSAGHLAVRLALTLLAAPRTRRSAG
jgi:peptidoglycan/xylan/chitin deacetylase (PgdA/CDA1 family)